MPDESGPIPCGKIEWCIYAFFTQDQDKIRKYCAINTQKSDAIKAQSLGGYLWAISSLKKEKIQIRCLIDTHVEDIKPPLTIVYGGNGCEAYSRDDTLVRHVYFQQFNEDYQNLTKYSLIEDLGIKQLTTDREIENLPNHLAALPVLRFNKLKRRLVEIKRPLHINSNVVAIIFLVGGVLLTPFLAYILWKIYRVYSRVKGLKPVIQLFNEKKGQMFNANALATNRLHTLEAK